MKPLILALLSLSLLACGKESDAPSYVGPAEPRDEGQRPPGVGGVIFVHEVCTVTFGPDGVISCVCKPVTP